MQYNDRKKLMQSQVITFVKKASLKTKEICFLAGEVSGMSNKVVDKYVKELIDMGICQELNGILVMNKERIINLGLATIWGIDPYE